MTVRIWLATVDDVDLAPVRGSFSAEELARAEAMVSPTRRHRFLARRWMARSLLARETARGPKTVCWSASRSADLAAVAIADQRLGLDLERGHERRRWEQIVHRFFSEDECQAVVGSPTRFLEFWTLKEAYLKALGRGLPGGLRTLECTSLSPALGDWSTSAAHPGWRFRNLDLAPGFVAALVVEGAPGDIEVRRWTTNGDFDE
jgi:4'-phosphopantetheinyl transferase